jgi:hypothetical protein
MNEIFKLPTKHDMLQNIILVFIRHMFPSLTQQTYNHSHKIQVIVGWEIPNYNSYYLAFGKAPNKML